MSLFSTAQGTEVSVLAVIMGGGQGTRLFPLTKHRSKPAVPLAGRYRLVDIPISNCINSNIRRIYVLTQFNSVSLHRHILQTYTFDNFSEGFIELLAAQQTLDNTGWYQGTADAVRQNLRYFFAHRPDYIIILSGDQLYRMDFRHMLRQHIETFADITVAVLPVQRANAGGLGILQTNKEKRIVRFVEKPKDPVLLDSLKIQESLLASLGLEPSSDHFLASMGIYIFSSQVLFDALNNDLVDFGKDIIPSSIQGNRVFAFIHQGYWEDIGTIGSFFDANIEITKAAPRFDFFDRKAPIYTRTRHLPGSKVRSGDLRETIVSEGCIIEERVRIERSVIGIRSMILSGCRIQDAVIMGSDFYEDITMAAERGAIPPLGIGRNCRIRRAIIDKNVRIGDDCVLDPVGKPSNFDHDLYYIRDGIVVVPKNMVIPPGTVI